MVGVLDEWYYLCHVITCFGTIKTLLHFSLVPGPENIKVLANQWHDWLSLVEGQNIAVY